METLQEATKSYKIPYLDNSKILTADAIQKAYYSFPHFFFGIFAIAVQKVDGRFEYAEHAREWCLRLQRYNKTSTVSAREHIKTTVALGKIAWKLYRTKLDGRYNHWLYMGYVSDLAEHHLKNLKRYINEIPEIFGKFESLTDAESILHYTIDGSEFLCEPTGMLNFKRGMHPKGIICDDILRDPEKRLDIGQIQKLSTIFFEQVVSMPREELHVFGTPQDEADLFSELEKKPGWNCKRYKAFEDEARGKVLWPQVWPVERLKARRAEIGEKAFNKEFQCAPVRGEEGYFNASEIDAVIFKRLINYGISRKANINGKCFGGIDIGKKRHPSHLSVFGEDRHNRYVQIISLWLDKQDYIRQIEICRWICESYSMQKLFYDDTRAEFEGFREKGELPLAMKGVSFTLKEKFEIATIFGKMVSRKQVMLLGDERQRRQILNVDNDLKSMEMEEGHGDSFWSVALALKGTQAPIANIRLL